MMMQCHAMDFHLMVEDQSAQLDLLALLQWTIALVFVTAWMVNLFPQSYLVVLDFCLMNPLTVAIGVMLSLVDGRGTDVFVEQEFEFVECW